MKSEKPFNSIDNDSFHRPPSIRADLKRYRENPLDPLIDALDHDDTNISSIFITEIDRYSIAYGYFYQSLERWLENVNCSSRWDKRLQYIEKKHLGPRQAVVAKRFKERAPYFELDLVNLIIHSRILCDRVIALSRYFWDLPDSPSFTSFNKHKRWCSSNCDETFAHETYTRKLARETDWFDMPLKFLRDSFFVHHGPPHLRFLGYQDDMDDLMMLIVLDNNDNRRHMHVSPRKLTTDIYEFLLWFSCYWGTHIEKNRG